MAHPLWKDISSLAIVGTDQMAISDELQQKLKQAGVPISDQPSDTLLKAIAILGLYEKAAMELSPAPEAPNWWQPEPDWVESAGISAQVWKSLLQPKFLALLEHVLTRMHHARTYIPAEYLPEFLEILLPQINRRPELLPLLDTRAVWVLQQLIHLEPLAQKVLRNRSIHAALRHSKSAEHLPAAVLFSDFLLLDPNGQKLAEGWTEAQLRAFPDAEGIARLEVVKQQTKAGYVAKIAQILALIPGTKTAQACTEWVTQLKKNAATQKPVKPDIDYYLQSYFSVEEQPQKDLAILVLTDKQIKAPERNYSFMLWLAGTLPYHHWQEASIPMIKLAASNRPLAEAIVHSMLIHRDATFASVFFTEIYQSKEWDKALDHYAPPEAFCALCPSEQMTQLLLSLATVPQMLERHYTGVLPNLVQVFGHQLNSQEQDQVLRTTFDQVELTYPQQAQLTAWNHWISCVTLAFDPHLLIYFFEKYRGHTSLTERLHLHQRRSEAELRVRLK